jgi:hypothetical protein
MNDLITNGTQIKQRIISEINNAEHSIKIAMAYFTDRDIAMSIVEAKNKKIKVDIILSSNAQNETVKLILKGAGVNVHAFNTGDPRGIMHHKFCLIDNKTSINGSYNYSLNASTNNVENIQVSDDLSTYNQFDSEFERLKFKIENQIDVAKSNNKSLAEVESIQPKNIIDTFFKQLKDLVYSAVQIDDNDYNQKGYNDSKNNKGNIDIFKTEYNNIKQKIREYATDNSLGNKKSQLTTEISAAYQSTKANIEKEKEGKIIIEVKNNNLEKQQIKDKISKLKEEQSILESGDNQVNEKGLLQVNNEIEKNKLKKQNLEQSVIIRSFWSTGTTFCLFFLGILIFYLSIFFSSALYKVFYEPNLLRNALEAGLKPEIPNVIDFNALTKIFVNEGGFSAFISGVFFLIPVLFSNIKFLGSKKQNVNKLMFWVGILVFDIIVATYVAITSDEIKNLAYGIESDLEIWQVFTLGEFWIIFVFGMFPLILVHFLISNIISAYNNSKLEILNADKNREIQILDIKMIELISTKGSLSKKLNDCKEAINDQNENLNILGLNTNTKENNIEQTYSELQKEIKNIYDNYNSRIKSGVIFTEVIFDTLISSYKAGYIGFLPEFYASNEVAERVKQIDQISTSITI